MLYPYEETIMKHKGNPSKALLLLALTMIFPFTSCEADPFAPYKRAENTEFLRNATRFALKPSRCNHALLERYPCEPVEALSAPIQATNDEDVNRGIHDNDGSIVTYLAAGGELVTKEYLPEDHYFLAEYLPKATVFRFQEEFARSEMIGFGQFDASENIIDGKYAMALSEAEWKEAKGEGAELDPDVNLFSNVDFLRFNNPSDIPFSVGEAQLSAIYQLTKTRYCSFYAEEEINLERYEPTICRASYEKGVLSDIEIWGNPRCNRDFLYHAGAGFGKFVYPIHYSRFEGHPNILCVNDTWYGGPSEQVHTFGRLDGDVISYPLAIAKKGNSKDIGEDDWAALSGGIYNEEIKTITKSICDVDDFFWGYDAEAKKKTSVRMAEIPFSSLVEITESKRETTPNRISQIITECY